jgi:hypothetical protein
MCLCAQAAAAVRRMSDKPPLPSPNWKQNPDLEKIIPSNMDQATGLERAEVLAEMAGKKVFDDDKVGYMLPYSIVTVSLTMERSSRAMRRCYETPAFLLIYRTLFVEPFRCEEHIFVPGQLLAGY